MVYYLLLVTSQIAGAFFGTFVISYGLIYSNRQMIRIPLFINANYNSDTYDVNASFKSYTYLPGITSLCPASIGD